MKQFESDLEGFGLRDNPIEVLDVDLFEFNSNLERIDFQRCLLKYIDPGFFENLRNLKKLTFVYSMQRNRCIDQMFDSRWSGNIETFEWNVENCTDITATDEI